MAPISHPSLAVVAAAAALISAPSASDAFILPTPHNPAAAATVTCSRAAAAPQSFDLMAQDATPRRIRSLVRLHAEGEPGSGEAESSGDEEAEGGAAGEGAKAEAEGEAEAEAEEEAVVEEDPEVTEIKANIAELEATIKRKRNELFEVQDAAEKYSQAGYLRKVAEMDQIRKTRGASFKSNEFTARAAAVQNFLPVLDELKALDTKYEGNDVAKSYSALRWDLNNALTSLGMTEYTAEVGADADPARFAAVREEYSDTHPKGTVISPVGIGMEIEGNVMRMAECVVSLGSEAEAMKEAEEKKEGGGETADDDDAGESGETEDDKAPEEGAAE